MTWQFTSLRGGQTKAELGGEVTENRGKGSRGLRVQSKRSDTMPLTKAPSLGAWPAQLSAQLLPDKPAGIGGRNGVRRRAEGASRASCSVPTAGGPLPACARGPVSGTKLQCVFGWGRRLTKNKTSVEDPWGSVGRKELSGGTKEESVSSRRYRKDVSNSESNPKDYYTYYF